MLIFNKENICNGWSLWYKTALIVGSISLPFYFINREIAESNQVILSLIFLLLSLFIFNFFAKLLAKKKYGLRITKFIGWSILWRSIIMNIPYQLVVVFPAKITEIFAENIKEEYLAAGTAPSLILIFLLCTILILLFILSLFFGIAALGWATTTVIKKAKDINKPNLA
jgi:hypothetical protein